MNRTSRHLFFAALLISFLASIHVNAAPSELDTLRKETLASARLRLQTVFSANTFPAIDFEFPALIKHVLGSYTITTTWYDAGLNQVTRPDKPGRYGAVIQIATPDGQSSKRFHTFFRVPGAQRMDWRMKLAADLPPQFGIDAAVVSEQSDTVSDYFRELFRDNFARDSRGAVLLATLYESKPGDRKMTLFNNNNPATRDREYWIRLKQKTGDYKPLQYLLFTPEDYPKDTQKRWPLMVFLHGAGERGENLELVKTHGPPKIVQTRKDFPFIVLSPQCRPNEWFLPVEITALIDETAAKYRVDPDRIYLTGLSMGGFGTWQTACQYPDRFAAIAPICGGGDPSAVDRIKSLPSWVFHGGKDPVVPVVRSTEMVDALKKIDGRVRLTIYPDAQHDSWTETYNNQELYSWFLTHRRSRPAATN